MFITPFGTVCPFVMLDNQAINYDEIRKLFTIDEISKTP